MASFAPREKKAKRKRRRGMGEARKASKQGQGRHNNGRRNWKSGSAWIEWDTQLVSVADGFFGFCDGLVGCSSSNFAFVVALSLLFQEERKDSENMKSLMANG